MLYKSIQLVQKNLIICNPFIHAASCLANSHFPALNSHCSKDLAHLRLCRAVSCIKLAHFLVFASLSFSTIKSCGQILSTVRETTRIYCHKKQCQNPSVPLIIHHNKPEQMEGIKHENTHTRSIDVTCGGRTYLININPSQHMILQVIWTWSSPRFEFHTHFSRQQTFSLLLFHSRIINCLPRYAQELTHALTHGGATCAVFCLHKPSLGALHMVCV